MLKHEEKLLSIGKTVFTLAAELIGLSPDGREIKSHVTDSKTFLATWLEQWGDCTPIESGRCSTEIFSAIAMCKMMDGSSDAALNAVVDVLKHRIPDPSGIFICECQEHDHAARMN